jgi:hypothetical protein
MRIWKLSEKEVKRVQVLTQVRNGKLTLSKAAELLALGYRQAKRVWKRFRQQGVDGLTHRSRGKPGHRRLRKRALAVVQRQYADYGPTLAAECLAEEGKIQVQPETLRRWGWPPGSGSRRNVRRIARVGPGAVALARCCRWTAAIMAGSRAAGLGAF